MKFSRDPSLGAVAVGQESARLANLVEEWPAKKRQPPPETVLLLNAIASECVVRERCRLRRLRRVDQ